MGARSMLGRIIQKIWNDSFGGLKLWLRVFFCIDWPK